MHACSYQNNYTSVDPKYELSGFDVEIMTTMKQRNTGNQLYTQHEHRQPVIHLAQVQATIQIDPDRHG